MTAVSLVAARVSSSRGSTIDSARTCRIRRGVRVPVGQGLRQYARSPRLCRYGDSFRQQLKPGAHISPVAQLLSTSRDQPAGVAPGARWRPRQAAAAYRRCARATLLRGPQRGISRPPLRRDGIEGRQTRRSLHDSVTRGTRTPNCAARQRDQRDGTSVSRDTSRTSTATSFCGPAHARSACATMPMHRSSSSTTGTRRI